MSRLTKKGAVTEIKYLHRRIHELEKEILELKEEHEDYSVVGKEVERQRDLLRYIQDRENYLEEVQERKQFLFDFLFENYPTDSKVKLLAIYHHGKKRL